MYDFKIKTAEEAKAVYEASEAAKKAAYEARLQPTADRLMQEIETAMMEKGAANAYFSSTLPNLHEVPRDAVKDLAVQMTLHLKSMGYKVFLDEYTSKCTSNIAAIRVSYL